jgi:antibiotic biosynthesis monooxygenase (ABM) superfamily enzyme
MRLASGTEDEFWRAQERMGPIVASQPGFVAVIGGPIANSRWTYFSGKFDSPDTMDQWYDSRRHKPVMDKAHETWFDAFFIRKWRRPADGEALTGPLFCETAIVTPEPLEAPVLDATMNMLTSALDRLCASPFETLAGEFEPQPFQLVGPLEEFPQIAPVRYLLLTHWDAVGLKAWLDSPEMHELSSLGTVSTDVHVLVTHAPGERDGLKADGSHRGWSRHATSR